MKKLGFDSMLVVDMGRYFSKFYMMKESFNLCSGIKGGYFKSLRKNDDRLEDDYYIVRGYEIDRLRILLKKIYF